MVVADIWFWIGGQNSRLCWFKLKKKKVHGEHMQIPGDKRQIFINEIV